MIKYKFYVSRSFRVSSLMNSAIKNNAEIIFTSKMTWITAIAGTETISVLCVSGVLCSPPQTTVQIK